MNFEKPSVAEKNLEQLKTEAQNDIGNQLAIAGNVAELKDAQSFDERLESAPNLENFMEYLEYKYGEKYPSVITYARISKTLNDYFERKLGAA